MATFEVAMSVFDELDAARRKVQELEKTVSDRVEARARELLVDGEFEASAYWYGFQAKELRAQAARLIAALEIKGVL